MGIENDTHLVYGATRLLKSDSKKANQNQPTQKKSSMTEVILCEAKSRVRSIPYHKNRK